MADQMSDAIGDWTITIRFYGTEPVAMAMWKDVSSLLLVKHADAAPLASIRNNLAPDYTKLGEP